MVSVQWKSGGVVRISYEEQYFHYQKCIMFT